MAKFFLFIYLSFATIMKILVIYLDIHHGGKGEFFAGNLNSGLQYLFISIAFGVISVKIYKRLEEFHYDYFEENKRKITIATLGLTLPIFLRSVWDLSKIFIGKSFTKVDMASQRNQMLNHVLSNLIGGIVPTVFQFSTMIFGLIRIQSKKT